MTFVPLMIAAMVARLQEPVFIDIKPVPKDDVAGLADVLIGALGLSGALLVAAAVAGLGLGFLIFWLRARSTPDQRSAIDR